MREKCKVKTQDKQDNWVWLGLKDKVKVKNTR